MRRNFRMKTHRCVCLWFRNDRTNDRANPSPKRRHIPFPAVAMPRPRTRPLDRTKCASQLPPPSARRCRSDEAPSNRAPAAAIRNSETAAPNLRAPTWSIPRKPTPEHRRGTTRLGATTDNFWRAHEKHPLSRNMPATKRACIGDPETQRKTAQTRVGGVRHRASPRMS